MGRNQKRNLKNGFNDLKKPKIDYYLKDRPRMGVRPPGGSKLKITAKTNSATHKTGN